MIEVSDLPGKLIGRFEGRDYGSSVSFFIGTFRAGTGPGLHRHRYERARSPWCRRERRISS